MSNRLPEPMHKARIFFWTTGMPDEAGGIPGYFKGSSYWSHDGADAYGPGEVRKWVYQDYAYGAQAEQPTPSAAGAEAASAARPRMLFEDEVAAVKHGATRSDAAFALNVIRKFCEVNGLTLADGVLGTFNDQQEQAP